MSGAAVAIAFKVLLKLQGFNMNYSHPPIYVFLCNQALLQHVPLSSRFYILL